MTNIPTLRAVLSRVESLKGPLTRGEAEKVADKLFIREHDRESWLDVVAALGGGRSALGAVCALIEREPATGQFGGDWSWAVTKPGYDAGVLSGKYGADLHHPLSSGGGPRWKSYADTPALALLAAYLRALIAEAEQAGQRAGKAS